MTRVEELENLVKKILDITTSYNYWDATLRSASDVIYKIKELCEDS